MADEVMAALLPMLVARLTPVCAGPAPAGLGCHHRLHGPGVLVVGDAASLCESLLAEGLRLPCISGRKPEPLPSPRRLAVGRRGSPADTPAT